MFSVARDIIGSDTNIVVSSADVSVTAIVASVRTGLSTVDINKLLKL